MQWFWLGELEVLVRSRILSCLIHPPLRRHGPLHLPSRVEVLDVLIMRNYWIGVCLSYIFAPCIYSFLFVLIDLLWSSTNYLEQLDFIPFVMWWLLCICWVVGMCSFWVLFLNLTSVSWPFYKLHWVAIKMFYKVIVDISLILQTFFFHCRWHLPLNNWVLVSIFRNSNSVVVLTSLSDSHCSSLACHQCCSVLHNNHIDGFI